MIEFYGRAFSLLEHEPASVLEIGVKGGASLELWRAMFPNARVVGADITPVKNELSEGITVVEADQAIPETIAAVGQQFGPFDLVIDDGSHIGEHMVNSMLALLPHLNPGALYVMEDILQRRKKPPGDDGWLLELVQIAVDYFGRRGEMWSPPDSVVGEKAGIILPRVATAVLHYHVLAFVMEDKSIHP